MSETHMFERLFRWDAWANDRVLRALRSVEAAGGKVPLRSIDRMAHLCRAQELWLSRLGYGEWEDGRALFPEGAELKAVVREAEMLAARWAQFARVLSPGALAETISYTTTEGEAFETRVEDILLHMSHHGAYHRGQIPVDFRHAGVRVPEGASLVTDYIFFVRAGVV